MKTILTLLFAAFVSLGTVSVGWAVEGGLPSAAHGDSSPEWEHLRSKLFAGRRIEADPALSRVQLIVPLRAAYGASVPVKIVSKLPQTPGLYVKRMWILVDKNPSPLAATLDLTTEMGQADFETRLRVDEYSHVRVVSELSNGQLHMDSRYVKTSGGCSAPPNRDALNLIGKTVFKLPKGVARNAPTPADITVVHPNDTGFELNQQTVMYIPSHFVRSISVSYADRKIFDADLDFSVSENPTLRFNFVPHGPGELRAEVEDSKSARFVGSLPVGIEWKAWLQRALGGGAAIVPALALVLAAMPVRAGLPAAYRAMVVEPQGLPERAEFDLTPALQRARQEKKRLYVYLGAAPDCPFCRKYEAFLDKNAAELAPRFAAKYLVVDLRSALSIHAPRLFIRIGKTSRAYADFQREIGDERARQLVYPSVWLFDGQAKPLMQMPAGTGTFETVEEQIEILDLVQ